MEIFLIMIVIVLNIYLLLNIWIKIWRFLFGLFLLMIRLLMDVMLMIYEYWLGYIVYSRHHDLLFLMHQYNYLIYGLYSIIRLINKIRNGIMEELIYRSFYEYYGMVYWWIWDMNYIYIIIFIGIIYVLESIYYLFI